MTSGNGTSTGGVGISSPSSSSSSSLITIYSGPSWSSSTSPATIHIGISKKAWGSLNSELTELLNLYLVVMRIARCGIVKHVQIVGLLRHHL